MAALATQAGRRAWVGQGVIALGRLVYAMDLTVLNLAVPQLSALIGAGAFGVASVWPPTPPAPSC